MLATRTALGLLAALATCVLLLNPDVAWSLPEPSAVCAYCNTPLPGGTHAQSCPYATTAAPSGGANAGSVKHHDPEHDLSLMVTGAVVQGLMSSLLSAPANQGPSQQDIQDAQRQAAVKAMQRELEWQRQKDADFAAGQHKMLTGLKPVNGDAGDAFKQLSGTAMGFKPPDDLDALAAAAREPFDTAGESSGFWGDTLSEQDVRLLVEPENDPRIVDLSKASTYVVQSLKDEQTAKAREVDKSQPVNNSPPAQECAALTQKLSGYLNQRSKFYQTVLTAQEQVNSWREANRNALMNAAKEGVALWLGDILETLAKRGQAAERLRRIVEQNGSAMASNGVDVAALTAKIERLKILSRVGQIAELANQGQGWHSFLQNGFSALLAELTSSNQEMTQILENPGIQPFVAADAPFLSAALDLSTIAASHAVFGKWVAKKMPVVAAAQFAVNQSYNALDWLLSFNRLAKSHEINGQVLASAQSLQERIDDTRIMLDACR